MLRWRQRLLFYKSGAVASKHKIYLKALNYIKSILQIGSVTVYNYKNYCSFVVLYFLIISSLINNYFKDALTYSALTPISTYFYADA